MVANLLKAPRITVSEHEMNVAILFKDIAVLKHQKHLCGVATTPEDNHYTLFFELHLGGCFICIYFPENVLLKSSDGLDEIKDYQNLRQYRQELIFCHHFNY